MDPRPAGTRPADDLDPPRRPSSHGNRLDISLEFPKPLTDDVVLAADIVITLGCGGACSVYPGRRYLDWPVDDPADPTLEQVRRTRDDIDTRTRHLLTELLTPPHSDPDAEARHGSDQAGRPRRGVTNGAG